MGTFHLFWCCQSLLLVCKEEAGEMAIERKNFKNFLIFNLQPMSLVSFICPFIPLGKVASKAWGGSPILYWVAFGFEWALFVSMLCLGAADKAFFAMAIAAYFCFALTVAGVRCSVRQKLGITGDLLSDACASCFHLPFALGQMAGEEFVTTSLAEWPSASVAKQAEVSDKQGGQQLDKQEESRRTVKANFIRRSHSPQSEVFTAVFVQRQYFFVIARQSILLFAMLACCVVTVPIA